MIMIGPMHGYDAKNFVDEWVREVTLYGCGDTTPLGDRGHC